MLTSVVEQKKFINDLIKRHPNEMIPTIRFVEVFKINMYLYNVLFSKLEEDIPIYITDELLIEVGYSGTFGNKKKNFKRTCDDHKIPYKTLNYEEMKELLLVEPSTSNITLPTSKNVEQSNFYFILPTNFKQFLMVMNTSKATIVRQYFIDIENLFWFNIKYQARFKEHQLELVNEKMQVIKLEQEEKSRQLAIKLEQEEKIKLQQEEKIKQLENEKIKKDTELQICYKTLRPNYQKSKGLIYISSSVTYIKENIFKIGKSTDPDKRVPNSNTTNIDNLEVLYTSESNNVLATEGLIFKSLESYRCTDKREMFRFPYQYIKMIVDICCKLDGDYTTRISEVFDLHEKNPITNDTDILIAKLNPKPIDTHAQTKLALLTNIIKVYIAKEHKITDIEDIKTTISVSKDVICEIVKLELYGKNKPMGLKSSYRKKPWIALFRLVPPYRNLSYY